MVQRMQAKSPAEQETAVRLEFEEYYREKAPWDNGVTPPELVALVEREPAGRALELGCGTGTNAVYLAEHGWEVVGVDLIERAIEQARAKADAAGVSAQLLLGDATRLDALPVGDGFSLVFDLSCFCAIPAHRRAGYAAGVTRVTAPGANLLMFGYGPDALPDKIFGVTADELRTRFSDWDLVDVTPGTNPFPTFWFTLRRR